MTSSLVAMNQLLIAVASPVAGHRLLAAWAQELSYVGSGLQAQ